MQMIPIGGKPYAVINGKDFAVYRWFDSGRAGPIFLQVAGRTPLHKEDLPTDDWKVVTSGDRSSRVWTAWRHPWFDTRLDSRRRLAFLGASSAGSLFLAFRYLTKRFGFLADEATLATRAAAIVRHWDAPFLHALESIPDAGLTDQALILLDPDSLREAEDAAALLGLESLASTTVE